MGTDRLESSQLQGQGLPGMTGKNLGLVGTRHLRTCGTGRVGLDRCCCHGNKDGLRN